MTNPDPDLESARAVAHGRLASLTDLDDDQAAYLDQVGDVRDEFTDLECTDGRGPDMTTDDA